MYSFPLFHVSIKFSAEISNEQHVFFLYTKASLEGDTIMVDMYTKPTDPISISFLLAIIQNTAVKPFHTVCALRFRHVCTDNATFDLRAKELSEQQQNRGYQTKNINRAIERTHTQARDDLLVYSPNRESSDCEVTFVWTDHMDLPKANDIDQEHWPTIVSSKRKSPRQFCAC